MSKTVLSVALCAPDSYRDSVALVCLFFEIFYKVIDLLFYLTGNNVLWCRSIEPVAEFIMSAR